MSFSVLVESHTRCFFSEFRAPSPFPGALALGKMLQTFYHLQHLDLANCYIGLSEGVVRSTSVSPYVDPDLFLAMNVPRYIYTAYVFTSQELYDGGYHP